MAPETEATDRTFPAEQSPVGQIGPAGNIALTARHRVNVAHPHK